MKFFLWLATAPLCFFGNMLATLCHWIEDGDEYDPDDDDDDDDEVTVINNPDAQSILDYQETEQERRERILRNRDDL